MSVVQDLSERVSRMEAKLLELERAVQTVLPFFEQTLRTPPTPAKTKNFLQNVAFTEAAERLTIIENVVRGMHECIASLTEGENRSHEEMKRMDKRIEKLSAGLQRHGEFYEQSRLLAEKRITELQCCADELRSRKLDASALRPAVENAVAGLSGQVRKLVAAENRRNRECHGNDDKQCPASKRHFVGLEISDCEGTDGVRVVRILPDSRSACAGLIEGDIITRIGCTAVQNRSDFWVTELPVVFEVIRGESIISVTVDQ
jgi:hypothetical protein